MYCSGCGNEVLPNAAVCLHCGQAVNAKPVKQDDKSSVGWWLLGFLIPLAGLILWLVWTDDSPKKAKSAGMGALVSTILSVVSVVVIYVVYFVVLIMIML